MSNEQRIKLTSGGPQYVSQFKHFKCPVTGKKYFIHPNKWASILEKNTEHLGQYDMIKLWQDSVKETQQIIAELILLRHDSCYLN